MSARPLFVYGTLRDPEVLYALLGRTLSASECVGACTPGFQAVHYPQRVYPALIAVPDGNAPGLLLHDLSATELAVLDAFEGDEYRRASISAMAPYGTVEADVYLPVAHIPADAEPWTLDNWTRLHKLGVLDGERRTSQALRDRLSVARKPAF
ncbi:gamma-glutamylcyclotransferase family protein [Devosia sp. UYZn731]|uniref:gamma-glutamylcyclotransferase family protein n=1 Tax=Devosia sp. UYZn731 TaxID=3156345 RepID=UPI003391E9EF